MPSLAALKGFVKTGFAGLKGAEWGKIGNSAWEAASTGFGKRAITGAALGAVGGAAKGAIVDYNERGGPLFSSLAINATKGAALGGLAYGAGGGLLGKAGAGFRGEFSKAFNGFGRHVGNSVAEGVGAKVAAAALLNEESNMLKYNLNNKFFKTRGTVLNRGGSGVPRPRINLLNNMPKRQTPKPPMTIGRRFRSLFSR